MKILFVDGTKGFSPTRLSEKPTGGILTSLTLIPRYLAKCGHDVYVYSVHDKDETVEGVNYVKNPLVLVPDVVVFNRNSIDRPSVLHFKKLNPAVRIVWWLHDIVQMTYLNDDGAYLADSIVALSEYCRNTYADFYGIASHRFSIIPNGVDRDVFYTNEEPRDSSLFIHCSAPVKGTYPLPVTTYNLRRHDPRVEVRSYASQRLHDMDDNDSIKREMEMLKQAGVRFMDPIPQKELADTFRKAWALLMPNHYPEICSNILLQARACGLPIVASNIGSVSEFIEHRETGMLTHSFPHDMFLWHKDFAEQVVTLQKDHALHAHISKQSPIGIPSWDAIGARWNKLLTKDLVEVS